MLNKEVFEQYGSERWVIEQTLCFMLQSYWEQYGKLRCEQIRRGLYASDMPCNPVTFVKQFMKEETLCEIEYAEKSKMNTLQNGTIIDVDCVEVAEVVDEN